MGIKLVSTFIDAATGKVVVHVSERAHFRRHEPSYICATARAMINRGERERAIDLIEEALPRHRKDALLHSQLAGTYAEMARQLTRPPIVWNSKADVMRVRAAKLYTIASNLNRNDSGFAMGAARAYESIGNIVEAFAFYRRAIHAQPLKAKSWVSLGDFFQRKNVEGQAQVCFQNAARVEGPDDIALTRLAELKLAPDYWGPIDYRPLGYPAQAFKS